MSNPMQVRAPIQRVLMFAVVSASYWCTPVTAAQTTVLPDFNCVIAPSTTADISSAVPGLLTSVDVDRSDLVTAGQVVARLDSGVEAAELQLASARAEIVSEIKLNEVNLEYDEINRNRLDSLHKGKAVSRQEREKAERNKELSRWRVRQAKDINRLRKLELTRTREMLKRKSVASPINGVVVRRYKTAGEYIEDQPILRIVQLDPLYIEAAVPMQYFGQIKEGMPAYISPATSTSSRHKARISVVDRMGDASTGTFGVRLELANPEYAIPAGVKCTLSFSS